MRVNLHITFSIEPIGFTCSVGLTQLTTSCLVPKYYISRYNTSEKFFSRDLVGSSISGYQVQFTSWRFPEKKKWRANPILSENKITIWELLLNLCCIYIFTSPKRLGKYPLLFTSTSANTELLSTFRYFCGILFADAAIIVIVLPSVKGHYRIQNNAGRTFFERRPYANYGSSKYTNIPPLSP